jgi:hypothetical protein
MTEYKKQKGLFNQSKYRNQGSYYCRRLHVQFKEKHCDFCNYHPSQLEIDVAKIIDRLVPSECWDTHQKLIVKPGTETYPALHWKVDFSILPTKKYPECPVLHIEAKGYLTPDFMRNIQFLEYFYPDTYRQLILIGKYDRRISGTLQQKPLSKFHQFLFFETRGKIPQPNWD